MSKKKQPQKRPDVLIRLCILYLLLLTTFGFAAELIAERHWFSVLLAYAPPILWAVPSVLLLPFALWKKDYRSLVLLAITLIPQPYLLGWQFTLPQHTRGTTLCVLTYNIEHGAGGIGAIAKTIRDSKADIICLQEANGFRKIADPIPGLRKALPNYTISRAGEIAIVSMHPLTNTRSFPLAGNRVALVGDVTWKQQRITVVAVHFSTALDSQSLANNKGSRLPGYLNRSGAARRQQAERLIAQTNPIMGPLIVCGDFNTPPRGQVYRLLTERFTDAFMAAGNGFGWTFPARFPLLRIDYVFSRGFQPYRARVLPHRGSDHRPFLTELRLPSPK